MNKHDLYLEKTCFQRQVKLVAHQLRTPTPRSCSYFQQVRLHPHITWSSLARTGECGFLAPCERMLQSRKKIRKNQKKEKRKKKKEKRKKIQNLRKPGNKSVHDCMRTWLHSALSGPAGYQGLSHVQQNYTDMPQRGDNMVPSSQTRTDSEGKRSIHSFFAMQGSVVRRNDNKAGSRSFRQHPSDFTGSIHVNDHNVVAPALSDKRRPEFVDPGPLHRGYKVHVVLLAVIGNSWLWDTHWYENK